MNCHSLLEIALYSVKEDFKAYSKTISWFIILFYFTWTILFDIQNFEHVLYNYSNRQFFGSYSLHSQNLFLNNVTALEKSLAVNLH